MAINSSLLARPCDTIAVLFLLVRSAAKLIRTQASFSRWLVDGHRNCWEDYEMIAARCSRSRVLNAWIIPISSPAPETSIGGVLTHCQLKAFVLG
jgi:hypothetical protein